MEFFVLTHGWNKSNDYIDKNDVLSQDESFNSGSATWDEISSHDEIFTFLHVIEIYFLY